METGAELRHIAEQANRIDARSLAANLERNDLGRLVAIDIESEDYEVSDDGHPTMDAADRLLERHPDAKLFTLRIG